MKQTVLAAVAVMALFAGACKRNDNNVSPVVVPGTYSSMDTIYTMLETQAKVVSLDAATGGTFYGNSGTRYVFPPAAFVDGNGNPVTGLVQIAVKEFLKKGDMIFSRVLPVSDGEPLLSGGEIYTNATQGGVNVYLAPGVTFTAKIPQGTTAQTGMGFFRGQEVTGTANKVNWVQRADSLGGGSIVYNGDTISILSDSLQWANADRFLTSPINYQSFQVSLSVAGVSGDVPASVQTMTLYDTYKGVWGMHAPVSSVVSEGHVPNIPVHFASYGVIGGKFYGGVIGPITPSNGGKYSITLTQVNPADFKAQLNNLTN